MIQKQPVTFSFNKGMDTKDDPWQVPAGIFLNLQNSVFDKIGRLTKRNGFGQLASLPTTDYSYLTTLNGNLTAIGENIAAYSAGSWVSNGNYTPMKVSTLPLIRNNLNQVACDASVSANGLVCTVYNEINNSTHTIKYAIANSITGQNIVSPRVIPTSTGTPTGSARVFLLGNYFIIMFTNLISGTSHLQYIAVSVNTPTTVTTNADIFSNYVPSATLSWDGVVEGNNLYIAYNNTVGGQNVAVTYLTSSLALATPINFATYQATVMSLCADSTNPASPVIYVNFYSSTSSTGYSLAVSGSSITPVTTTSVFSSGASTITVASAVGLRIGQVVTDSTTGANIQTGTFITSIVGTTIGLSLPTAGNSASTPGDTLSVNSVALNTVMTPTEIISSGTILNLASAAQNGVCTIYSEVSNNYSYDSAIPSHYINAVTVTQPATVTTGTVGTPYVVIRSLGLGSKAFIQNGTQYFVGAYQSPYQPTYFLVNGSSSTSSVPIISAKLAYENGGGYLTLGLPNAQIVNNIVTFPYLRKDLVEALSTLNNSQQTTTGGIYTQTGVNLGTFNFTSAGIDTSEISDNLHLGGGFLWQYDGYLPVEHDFFLWPDSIECTWSATGGAMVAKPDGSTSVGAYYYQVVYEWSDNQGNVYRSAPSIPVAVTTSGSASTGSVTVDIPMLRLTMKTANPVKIVVYRWSVAQQSYFQVTSITAPQLNDTTTDSLAYVDTLADSSIIGNNLIYTTGGVVEDINAPATNIITLFDNRLWMVNSEDPNQLFFSKQVFENTPVEMSDLLTYFVAPTSEAVGPTGPITALAPMDNNLIIFKKNSIYYINGTGPNDLGQQSQYSQVTFITSSVGCVNQQSIVLIDKGLMFQSSKGIWLLTRGLQADYIGAPMELYNGAQVVAAVNVPSTNQVRFTLDTGQTLMFDYFVGQWGTFIGIPGVSSCVFNDLHTFINKYGAVYQETPGVYVDGTNPVLLSFQTGWFNLAGLQGYQRIYDFMLLGQYISPHFLNVQIGYDYSVSPSQQVIIQPNNFTGNYGSDPLYGQTTPYGGPGNLEQWRIHTQRQTCESFQLSVSEIFNPFFGTISGAGFTMSGVTCGLGIKKGFKPIKAANSAG